MCVCVCVCDSPPKQPVSVNVRRNTERCIMVSIIDCFLPRDLLTAPPPHTNSILMLVRAAVCARVFMFSHSPHTYVGKPIKFACSQLCLLTVGVKFPELNADLRERCRCKWF